MDFDVFNEDESLLYDVLYRWLICLEWNQCCGCWWSGALAPGHRQPQWWQTPYYAPKIFQLLYWYLLHPGISSHNAVETLVTFWEVSHCCTDVVCCSHCRRVPTQTAAAWQLSLRWHACSPNSTQTRVHMQSILDLKYNVLLISGNGILYICL